MTCDGCGQPGATTTLNLAAPLGNTYIHVHDNPDCIEAAVRARGGGRILPDPEPVAGELFPRAQRERSTLDPRTLPDIRAYAA